MFKSLGKIFISTIILLMSYHSAIAQQVNGEVSLGIKGIKFKDIETIKPLSVLEFGQRWNNLGVMMSLGVANIDSERYYSVLGIPYLQEINYYPLELNVKGFLPLNRMELGAGIGFSMNYLDFTITNEFTDKEVQSDTNLLFGVQGLAEIKFLFPSTSGIDAFVGIEGEYQYVGRTKTFLGDRDLSNYRIGIKLGGRF